MFKINNTIVKFHDEYTKYPRTKVTSTIRTEYWNEYKKLMKSANQEYSKGFDIMIEMLGENENFLQEFVERLRKY
jgi:hypothetical protein